MYFVYVLRCVDSSLYCGYTSDVAHRIKAHCGKVKGGAKYTRLRPPVKVEAVWSCADKGVAMGLEKLIKNLQKKDKERIISGEIAVQELFGDKISTEKIVRDASCEGAV